MNNTEPDALDEIIRKLCHDFENPTVDSLNAQVEAKQKLQAYITKQNIEARIGERQGFLKENGEEMWGKLWNGWGDSPYSANLKALTDIRLKYLNEQLKSQQEIE